MSIIKAGSNFICFVTCSKLSEAKKIAGALVSGKLAACVNIIKGIDSIYSWKGKIHKDSEALMLIKGNFRNQKRIETKIRSLHSYEVPEIIFVKLDSGSKKYMDWLNANFR